MELIDIAIVLDQIIRAGLILGTAYMSGQMMQADCSKMDE
jgi:hypothetical protein